MSFARAVLIWKIIALALAAIYAIAGIVGLLADWEAGEKAIWFAFLGGGALLILLGNALFNSSPPLAAILVSVGAAAGGFALFWLIVVPIAAAVVIALSFTIARQAPAAS